MTTELTNVNSQELIQQSRALAGTTGGNFIPYIPVYTVNNQKTEKEVDIDGKMTKVEVPAVEGFNVTLKNEETGKYETRYYDKTLAAPILRIRYALQSKFNIEPRFYSYEFDRFDEMIKVYDENKQVVAQGNYQELKKVFATGEKNTAGKPKAAFDLQVILYIDLGGNINRLRLNGASRSSLFDYLKTFGQNDVFTAYITKFNLKLNEEGKIKFWYIEFERGEQVDLAKEIPLQKELQKYFDVEKFVKQGQPLQNEYAQPEPAGEPVIEYEQPSNDTIKVDQIPF